MSSKSSNQFRFRRNDSIGAPGAEEDSDFLTNCFVDTGDSDFLSDATNRHVIILGRTGTGKTALLKNLEEEHSDRVINIKPDNLALTYIANSNVLNTYTELGINLDPFYKLLWRHVFTVEILTRFFDQKNTTTANTFSDRLRSIFPGMSREDKDLRQAIDYLEEWGKEFWNETEYRVKEITQKFEKELEQNLQSKLGTDWSQAAGNQNKTDKLSEEQKVEVVNRGQEIVSRAQVRDLHQVFTLLDKVLTNKQKTYYIVLDGLDENWVDEKLRYQLIMGLIQTAREFIQVENAKVLIALRRDLLERVFRNTRDSGFQEEKFQGLYLPLTWTHRTILEILDRRVRFLVKRRYTKQDVTYTDLLPSEHIGQPIGKYIHSIAKNPRDVIALFNSCISVAVDKSKLTKTDLTKAVGDYSRLRLRALGDEWHADYPALLDFAQVLNSRPTSFKSNEISKENLESISLNCLTEHSVPKGKLLESAQSLINEDTNFVEFRKTLLLVFYRVGLIGLKTSPEMSAFWADDANQSVTRGQINDNTSVVIAPKYAIALGVGG